ncbi:MAG: lytic transglycosylase domain-containing protein, partial [Actinomycetota bacterium]|nr:lytic transglycosylase domain-containing protein [Actinomycetota bacterium]
VRTTLVYSGVAAAATGISVASGVLSNNAPTASPAAASDLSAARLSSALNARDLLSRAQSVSRSAGDRRATADKVKKAALSNAAGVAKTNVAKISTSDPKSLTQALMPQFGLATSEFGCLDRIWTQESGWNVHAANPSSSAYGIPQALPGSKMSSAGPDWVNNAETQIRWGLGYIRDRYGSACSAWGFKMGHGWY